MESKAAPSTPGEVVQNVIFETTGLPLQLSGIVVDYTRLPAFLLIGGRVIPPKRGLGFGDGLPVVQAWTPGNKDWENLPPMHVKREAAAVALANGILFVLGGFFEYENPPFGAKYHRSAEMLPLHGRQRKWVSLPAMQTDRAGGAVLNGRLYVFGGQTTGSHDTVAAADYLTVDGWKADHEFGQRVPPSCAYAIDHERSRVYFLTEDGIRRWDAVTRIWESNLPLPPEPDDAELAVNCSLTFLNDTLYFCGRGLLFAFHLRSPGASWEKRAEMPYRQDFAPLAYRGHLLAFGGADGPDSFFVSTDTVLSYSPTADTWTVQADVKVPDCRRAFSIVSNEEEGALDQETWNAVQQYLAAADA